MQKVKRSKFILRQAENKDNKIILDLIGTPILGDISLSFKREPNYFKGLSLQADQSEVWICEHTEEGKVVGMAHGGLRKVQINGNWNDLLYVCDLRIAKDFKKSRGLALLLLKMGALMDEHECPGFCCVFSDNHNMLEHIEKRKSDTRTPWMQGEEIARIRSYMIAFRRGRRFDPGIIQDVDKEQWQIFRESAEYMNLSSSLPEFSQNDKNNWFFKTDRSGQILASIQLVDASEVKQTIISAYSAKMKWLRPLINASASIFGGISLPEPGNQLKFFYVHHMQHIPGERKALLDLIQYIQFNNPDPKMQYFLLGLDTENPLDQHMEQIKRKRTIDGKIFTLFTSNTSDMVHMISGPVAVEVVRI